MSYEPNEQLRRWAESNIDSIYHAIAEFQSDRMRQPDVIHVPWPVEGEVILCGMQVRQQTSFTLSVEHKGWPLQRASVARYEVGKSESA